MENTLSTKEKSVRININSMYYGSIAEIGGGQETARHLFQAGGASNTVAKSVSAYDKLFSDHFYNQGAPSRYVAEDRLSKMIDYEYNELVTILDKKNSQKFFVFANTVEILNFTKTNRGNGWLGMAVEGNYRYQPNKIYIHVKLHENDTLLQQYTLGALGINLIHAGLFSWDDPRKVLLSLLDNLDVERVEVDYIYVEGPDFDWVDNRLLNLMLVRNKMTPAIMFDQDGKVRQPSDMLYHKNILLMRGYFRPIDNLGIEFIEDSLAIFKRDEDYRPDNTFAFCEISINDLMHEEAIDEKDFLHRVDLLNMMGQCVMISVFSRYFELVNYFRQFKMIKLRMVIGLPTFDKILNAENYIDLPGGLLEATAALFQHNVKVYLYPHIDLKTGELIVPCDNYFKGDLQLLWQYLIMNKNILVLDSISSDNLKINSKYISQLIIQGNDKFQLYVPDKVFNHIKTNKLFGYNTQQQEIDK